MAEAMAKKPAACAAFFHQPQPGDGSGLKDYYCGLYAVRV